MKVFTALSVLAILLAIICPRAEASDEQYLKVLSLIEQADSLGQKGQQEAAKAKYEEAQAALVEFKRSYPNWRAKVVAYRMSYVADRIAALSPKPAEPEKPQTSTVARTPGPQLKLIDAGAEPRKALRFQSKAGDKQTVEMILSMAMDMGMGHPMKMPPLKTVMDVTVKSVSPEGDISYETVITDAGVLDADGVAPEIVEVVKGSLSGMTGISTHGTLTARGFNKATDVRAPPGANPQTRQYMEQMKDTFAAVAAPFPEEPVGPGATWEVKLPLKTQGMTVNQTTTYELISIDGDLAVVKSAISQHAANQKIQNPAMPAMKVDVTKMASSGTGDVTFDLTRIIPTLGTVESQSEISMGMNLGAQKQTMVMKMDMNMRIESK